MPNLHEFPYDPFQRQAIEHIDRGSSVFVAAPTGAGKTVLADYVVAKAMDRGERVIYTAPIKALSNQKFRDYSARYGERIGIMTGDVTINPAAPLIIMTTEIYRNSLLEQHERFEKYSWIVFDEIHYLDDLARGTVWEESIMFTPDHINMLCLSATIPNVEQIAQWIREVHHREVAVVVEDKRPVPLHPLFQCQNRLFESLRDLKRYGYQGQEDWSKLQRRYRGRGPAHRFNRLPGLVEDLKASDRLPCILFTFGRRRAEDIAWELAGFDLIGDAEREALLELYQKLCRQFQIARDDTIEMLERLLRHGTAFHHAGMLPTTKEIIERCFTSRLLKMIVTTETFALGINMPARSVVLDNLKKRTDNGFALLKRREFLQMSGRAGRRGMDAEGYVYLRLNPNHVSLPDVQRILTAEAEPVRSRFNLGYATLLNLYRRHKEGLLDLFPQTLFYYQSAQARRAFGLEQIRSKLELLYTLGHIEDGQLTARGEFASWVYGYELLLSDLYERGVLSPLDPVSLAVLLLGLIYEPRAGLRLSAPDRQVKRLARLCKQPLEAIHGEERRLRISPLTKTPNFDLSRAMEAWMRQVPFTDLNRYAEVDDGEIVRNFRMTLQLLRQLMDSPACDPQLRKTAETAFYRINRDVVDAEAQLRLGQE